MIEAMIGRRMAEVGGPRRRPRTASAMQPALELDGRPRSGAAFRDVDARRAARARSSRSSASSDRVPPRSARRAFGIRELDAGEPGGRRQASAVPATDRRRSTRASASCPPTARPAARSWCGRSRRTWPSRAGRDLAHAGLISDRTEAKALPALARARCRIRSRNDPSQPMGTLSGGNQQKVLLARWLERDSRALVLIEPTRGVDVGARADIYRSLRDLAARGVAVLVVTSDYEEVVQVADRALRHGEGPWSCRSLHGRRDHHEPAAGRGRRIGVADEELSGGVGRAAAEPLETGAGAARRAVPPAPGHRSIGGRGSRSRRRPRSLVVLVVLFVFFSITSPYFLNDKNTHRHPPADRARIGIIACPATLLLIAASSTSRSARSPGSRGWSWRVAAAHRRSAKTAVRVGAAAGGRAS